MNGWLVLIALLVTGLAVAAGVVVAGELRHRERVTLDAWSWRLWRWEQEVVAAADARGCPGCRLLREREHLLRTPSSERRQLD